MTTTRDIPLASYPTGTRTFVKQTPNGLNGFTIAIARNTTADTTIWPDPLSRINLLVECSFDGGVTFPANAGSASWEGAGGLLHNKLGAEIPFSVFSANFDPAPNAVRVTVQIINGPIKTSGDVTVL